MEASRALVELNTCLSSLKRPQFQSPHSTLHCHDYDTGDGGGDDDHGDGNDNEENLSADTSEPPLFAESTSRFDAVTFEALESRIEFRSDWKH